MFNGYVICDLCWLLCAFDKPLVFDSSLLAERAVIAGVCWHRKFDFIFGFAVLICCALNLRSGGFLRAVAFWKQAWIAS